MAKKKYHRRPSRWRRFRRSKAKIPLAVVGGMAGTILMPNETYTYGAIEYVKAGNFDYAIGNVIENLTGYSMGTGRWSWSAMLRGLTPMFAGLVVHKLAGKFGINQAIRKVPYVNI
jgi:hypothetical protein